MSFVLRVERGRKREKECVCVCVCVRKKYVYIRMHYEKTEALHDFRFTLFCEAVFGVVKLFGRFLRNKLACFDM